jgi:hypothetical protein
MTDDLVNRLRAYELPGDRQYQREARTTLWSERQEAADRIEKLERENNDIGVHLDGAMVRIEKLKEALREIAALGFWDGDSAMNIARKALEGKDE